MVLGVFLGFGAIALVVVNSDLVDTPAPATPPPAASGAPVPTAPPRPSAPHLSSTPAEAPDIPALESMRSEGLTIVAEGLPRVIALDPNAPPQALAGVESCRFAYAVWEFSPNQAYRFMSTCGAAEGETLVGAYQIDGSRIRMSPLQSGPVELVSVFEVQRPSSMTTEITVKRSGRAPIRMRVKQRVTGMRQGMDGDAWRRSYIKKNTIKVNSGAATRPPPGRPAPRPKAPPPEASGDPVLDLIRGNN